MHWLFSLLVPGRHRDPLMAFLRERGIDSRPFFHALHTLPVYQDGRFHGHRRLDHARLLGETGLNLPTDSRLDEHTIDRIMAAMVEYFAPHTTARG